MDAPYNDVALWKYKDLVSAYGATPDSYKTYQIKTRDEVHALLQDAEFAKSDKLRLVELYMRKDDAPRTLVMTAEASARNNAKQ